jgi:hypothetical protein
MEYATKFLAHVSLMSNINPQKGDAALDSLIQAYGSDLNCTQYEGYGFALDTCTWRWKWTMDTNEAVLCQVGICVFYAALVWFFQLFQKPTKGYKPPQWLESLRWLHNVSLSAVSLWMMVTMIRELHATGRFNSFQSMACVNTDNSGLYGFANFVYLASKVWEWADTIFLILSGKQVIFLHYFHHMTTFTMAAVVHNFPVGGYCFLNCGVHFIMYLHYAYPVKWARSLITSTQLLQFVIVITIHTYGYLNPTTCFDMAPVTREWWFNETVVVGFFVLFLNFFAQQYLVKKPKGDKKVE